jgi:hypothetical protein
MDKLPQITAESILRILRKSETNLFTYPNRNLLLTFKKMEWDEDSEQAFEVDVEVRFLHENYESITRSIYNMDSDTLRQGAFGIKSPIEAVRLIVERLEQDGYVKIKKQPCSYHTEYGRRTEYTDDGDEYEVVTDAKKYFTKDEQLDLSTAIVLTTKGFGTYAYFKKTFYSEPLAVIAIIVSIFALLVSIFK